MVGGVNIPCDQGWMCYDITMKQAKTIASDWNGQ